MSVALLVEAIGNSIDCGEMSSSRTTFHVVYALVDRSELDCLLVNFLVKAAIKDARLWRVHTHEPVRVWVKTSCSNTDLRRASGHADPIEIFISRRQPFMR
jgi:hypothetical protein